MILSLAFYMDLQKAFDSINHEILLHKLSNYPIRGTVLQWFKNYLDNRPQFVVVNGVPSNTLPIRYGVPQGSTLGPLLFLVYINDINNAVPGEKLKLFADDTNLFVQGPVMLLIMLTCCCLNYIVGLLPIN